jgi:galactose mutarotase-like enzyme
LPLHGAIANKPARKVSIEVTETEIILRGEVDETMLFGPALSLNCEIRTHFNSGALTINDTVTNTGKNPTEHELLYHVNYGTPLLEKGSKFMAPIKEIAPRDSRAAEGAKDFDRYDEPKAGFVEQVYFMDLAAKRGVRNTVAMLRNAQGDKASVLRFKLKDFPCFSLWKNTAAIEDGYVTGLEPSTSYPNARNFERNKGRVLMLKGGESRSTSLSVEILETKKAIRAVEGEIRSIQKGVKPKLHKQPIGKFSNL